MAIVGVNVEATSDYIIKRDRDSDQPTRFKLGTLSSRVLGALRDRGAAFVANQEDAASARAEFKGNQVAHDVVRFGLRGWSGFVLADGSEIPFSQDESSIPGTGIKLPAVPDSLVELLPLDDLQELSEAIQKANSPEGNKGKS